MDNIQAVATFEPRPISPTLTYSSFVNRISKLKKISFKKKNSVPLDTLAKNVTNANTETAKVHKPYVLLPSFVFGEELVNQDIANETFTNFAPLKTSRMDQSGLDLKNVIVSCTNENYVPPSSLPKLPPLHFHTFKRPSNSKSKKRHSIPNASNFETIELAPDQSCVDNLIV